MVGKFINITLTVMILVILPVTIFLFTRTQSATQQAAVEYNCDINLDKTINNTDYEVLMKCYQQDANCKGLQKYASDLNNDNTINEKDINYFLTKCRQYIQR